MWHSWEEYSTQNNRKRLQASERNKDQVTSLALDTVYTKKTKTFFLQGSVVQVTGGSSLAIADNLGKNLAGPKTGKCHFGPVGPIVASEDLVGPPTFPLKSKLFLPQRLHSPCLQHWVLYAETTRPPPALGSPALFIATAIPYLPPTEGYVAKPPNHAIQNRNDRSTLQSIVLESPKITIENIYSDEEHSERGATGKTTREPIG